MIVGRGGPAVIISAETAYYIEKLGRLSELRMRARGSNPRVAQELIDIREAAMSFDRARLPEPAEAEVDLAEMAAELEQWLTSLEVADRLGLTDRRVRQMCDAGLIEGAEKVSGRWRLSLEDFQRHKAARAA